MSITESSENNVAGPSINEMSLEEVLEFSAPSDALRGIVVLANAMGLLPYNSVSDYMRDNSELAISKLAKIPNMKPKHAREFNKLINKVYTKSEFTRLPLAAVFNFVTPSNRLKNCIMSGLEDGSLPYKTIGDFLEAGEKAEIRLWRLPNMGKKSVSEFIGMLKEAQLLVNVGPYETEPDQDIYSFLTEILVKRELDVILRRIGGDDSRSETLEEIAKDYGVTRERIRQIEAKAFKKCRATANIKRLQEELEEIHDEIYQLVIEDKSYVLCEQLDVVQSKIYSLTPTAKLLIMLVYNGLAGWMDANFKHITFKGNRIGWVRPGLLREDEHALFEWMKEKKIAKFKWTNMLMDAFYLSDWPVDTRALAAKFPNLSSDDVAHYLENNFNAKIVAGVVERMDKLSPVRRMIYILRDAKKALHTSEIRAKHYKMFGIDMLEHAIGATLQRMSEALIIERGVYNLYENLSLNSEDLKDIVDKIYSYVKMKGVYVSAKVAYKDLFYANEQYGRQLTDYMVLGIAQDDDRFSFKRGLMIGLKTKEFEETFTSLYESIHQIVEDYGPISPSEMKEQLFTLTHRDILTVTINMVFKASDKYVAVDTGVYELISRAIGSDDKVDRIRRAIEIALLDGPISAFHLVEKLETIGINIKIFTLCSLCSKFDNIGLSDQLVFMPDPSDDVRNYNEVYETIFDPSKELSANRKAIKLATQDEQLKEMVSIDWRLSDEGVSHINFGTETEQHDLISKLVEEFEF